MKSPTRKQLDDLWTRHNAQWRDTAQIATQWQEAAETDPKLLEHEVQGSWWETIADCGITLLVTREYEHLAMGMCVTGNRPRVSYMHLPHPSGLAIDRERGIIHVASTRNPNQIFDLAAVGELLERGDISIDPLAGRPLVPVRSRYFPGCLYLHDLALVAGELHGTAVGENSIVRFREDGGYDRVWFPRCIESKTGPVFDRNLIQLNSVAAGPDLSASYFTASTDQMSRRRPGHRNFPVDRRGVVLSGQTREPVAHGLTRPHSARLYGKLVGVDNSGYGEFGFVEDDVFRPVIRSTGWTRGLCFFNHLAFVGSSRVIPRFRHYAPGLDVDASQCGVHAVDLKTGRVLGSLIWPYGNQVFAVDWAPRTLTTGFPVLAGKKRRATREKLLFYAFKHSLMNRGTR